MRVLLATALLFAGPGLAAPVTDYNGTYDTDCDRLGLDLHLNIGGSAGGAAGGRHLGRSIPLNCERVVEGDAVWQGLWDRIHDACAAVPNVNEARCVDLADALTNGATEFNAQVLDRMPTSITVRVNNPRHWLQRLLRRFWTRFTYHTPTRRCTPRPGSETRSSTP